jgi:predicted PurR-regulated permease PerM
MEKNKKPLNVNITFNTIVKTTIFFILLYLIVELKDLVLIFLTAIVLASSVEPFVKRMEKVKFPRILSVSIVYVILTAVIFWISVLFIPALIEQVNNFIKHIPQYIESLNAWLDTLVSQKGILYNVIEQTKLRVTDFVSNISEIPINGDVIKSNGEVVGGLVVGLFGGIFNFILVLVFSFYLAIQDQGIDNFLRIITPVKYTKYSLNL